MNRGPIGAAVTLDRWLPSACIFISRYTPWDGSSNRKAMNRPSGEDEPTIAPRPGWTFVNRTRSDPSGSTV
jgi:hypothetical protein